MAPPPPCALEGAGPASGRPGSPLRPARRAVRALLAGLGSVVASLATGGLAACGPLAHIPALPTPRPVADTGAPARLARAIAPVLLPHRDEPFDLARVVAVVHPTRPVVAYHLLWRDDAHAAWIPRTIPTDEEIVWVGHDSTGAPTEVWTYWHGAILHTPWPGRQVAIAVQWGKHGSLPLGTPSRDLPFGRGMTAFWAYHWLGLPDLLLGRLQRPGPTCFCHGLQRYGELGTAFLLADRLDAVVVARDPEPTLAAVFGTSYSRKPAWPWREDPSAPDPPPPSPPPPPAD
jgi:hypothetical protein